MTSVYYTRASYDQCSILRNIVLYDYLSILVKIIRCIDILAHASGGSGEYNKKCYAHYCYASYSPSLYL